MQPMAIERLKNRDHPGCDFIIFIVFLITKRIIDGCKNGSKNICEIFTGYKCAGWYNSQHYPANIQSVINMAWYKTVFARAINYPLTNLKSSFYTQKGASKPGFP